MLRWAVLFGSFLGAMAWGAAPPVITSVLNNASYSANVAPGTIAAIFGTNLTDGTSCLSPACARNFPTVC